MKSRSFELHSLPVGQLQANCYLIIDTTSRDGLIIDPGDEANFLKETIERHDVRPRLIVGTHGHFDHIMAVVDIALSYQLPFWLHQDDVFLVDTLQSSAQHFLGTDPGPSPKIDRFLIPGESLQLGEAHFEVLHTPGHTPGSISLYERAQEVLLPGDTLFAGGSVGRTDFSYSNPQHLQDSVRRLLQLPEETTIYPGHGHSSTIARERLFHG